MARLLFRMGILVVSFLIMSLGLLTTARASDLAPLNPLTTVEISSLKVHPINNVDARSFFYGSNPKYKRYCIENSEGDCLSEGLNTFIDLSAAATIHGKLLLYYQGQINDDQFRSKKAFAKLKTGIVSWELGKDSIWMGHGYHGSLLLSTNAEGFPLFKFQTDEPFHLPWILSRVGNFSYLFFHGWLDDFRMMGHRLDYWPIPILQLGANQTVVYDERYDIWEIPKVLLATEENIPGKYDNDQRASLDIALYLPILAKVSRLTSAKLYAEYAGEDMVAWWQEGESYKAPIGFDFYQIGTMGGLLLTTDSTSFRAEYSQNYRNDLRWYSKIPFLNDGILMGHHMGRDADDLLLGLDHQWDTLLVHLSYDRERHGLTHYPDYPEIRDQFIVIPSYNIGRLDLFASLTLAYYTNVDLNPDPLDFDIIKGTHRREFAFGIGISLPL